MNSLIEKIGGCRNNSEKSPIKKGVSNCIANMLVANIN